MLSPPPTDDDEILSRSEQRARIAKQVFSDKFRDENPDMFIRRLAYPDNSSSQKIDLAHRLSHCGREGDRKSIIAVLGLLQDSDQQVRRFALDALERLIPMHNARDFDGRKEVIQALGHMCTDYNKRSRDKALELLVAVAEKSDPDVLAAVMSEVYKESDELPLFARLAAVNAVPDVVKRGDPWAIQPLIAELDDDDPAVRHNTVGSLCKIAQRGNQLVIEAFINRLHDEDIDVRLAVIQALVELGNKGDCIIIEAMCDSLMYCEHPTTKLSLTKALVTVSVPEFRRTIQCLLEMIHDQDVNVRLAVSESIGVLASHGDFDSCIAMMGKLNHAKALQVLQTSKNIDGAKQESAGTTSRRFTFSGVDFKINPATTSVTPASIALDTDFSHDGPATPAIVGRADAELSSEGSSETSTVYSCNSEPKLDAGNAEIKADGVGSTDGKEKMEQVSNSGLGYNVEDKVHGIDVSYLPLTPPYTPTLQRESISPD